MPVLPCGIHPCGALLRLQCRRAMCDVQPWGSEPIARSHVALRPRKHARVKVTAGIQRSVKFRTTAVLRGWGSCAVSPSLAASQRSAEGSGGHPLVPGLV